MSSSGVGEERTTDRAWRIRSASEGPPRRVFRAAGFRERGGWWWVCAPWAWSCSGCWGWEDREAEEFSMLHFRRSLRPGSFIVYWGRYLVVVVMSLWLRFSSIDSIQVV